MFKFRKKPEYVVIGSSRQRQQPQDDEDAGADATTQGGSAAEGAPAPGVMDEQAPLIPGEEPTTPEPAGMALGATRPTGASLDGAGAQAAPAPGVPTALQAGAAEPLGSSPSPLRPPAPDPDGGPQQVGAAGVHRPRPRPTAMPPAAEFLGGGDTDANRLDRQGRKLNLVNREMLLRSIDQAVRAGVRGHFHKIDAELLDRVVLGTRTELVRLLKESSRSVRGLPKSAFLREVEEDRARILAEQEQVQAELERLMVQLDGRRKEVNQIEEQLLWEARQEGIEEDEALTQRIFEMFGGTDATHEMSSVREQVTFMLLQALQGQREKVVEAKMAEHQREVQNFERRISKLTESLELTEDELQRIAKAKSLDTGVASIYRTVQGLSDDEGNFEAKMEMMASIFEANLSLQKGGDSAD